MSGFKIDAGDGKTVKINQGINDVKIGMQDFNDLSRISAYSGPNQGVHTGANSQTIGRHDSNFIPKK